MRFRFRPIEASFYDLFAESAGHLVVGADLLAEMLNPANDRNAIAEKMREAEHNADTTTHEIVNLVNSTFITPFDREDIYRLAGLLDDVMDYMDETVDDIVLYDVHSLPAEFAEFVEIVRVAAKLTSDIMPSLRTMKDLDEYWIEINRLENQGDRMYRRIVAKLFSGQYEALDVLKYKSIVDSIEAALDAFESVANTVEQIAVKES